MSVDIWICSFSLFKRAKNKSKNPNSHFPMGQPDQRKKNLLSFTAGLCKREVALELFALKNDPSI